MGRRSLPRPAPCRPRSIEGGLLRSAKEPGASLSLDMKPAARASANEYPAAFASLHEYPAAFASLHETPPPSPPWSLTSCNEYPAAFSPSTYPAAFASSSEYPADLLQHPAACISFSVPSPPSAIPPPPTPPRTCNPPSSVPSGLRPSCRFSPNLAELLEHIPTRVPLGIIEKLGRLSRLSIEWAGSLRTGRPRRRGRASASEDVRLQDGLRKRLCEHLEHDPRLLVRNEEAGVTCMRWRAERRR